MMKQTISQTQKFLSLYELKLAKARRQCDRKRKQLTAAEKKCDENSQSIKALQANLQQMQQQLIKTGELNQWQGYQVFAKSQCELNEQLESQKSKLEFQLAVARQRVDKSFKALRVIRHKFEIILALKAQCQRRSCSNINEREDESSAQQWQHTRISVEI